jgi:adenylate kinase
VLFFELSDELALGRILGRARDEGREDDTPDVIARRLAIYHDQTEPVVEYYRASGKLVPLHADRSIGEVAAEIGGALDLLEGAKA